MKWQVDPQTKKLSITEESMRQPGDDYTEDYFTIYSWFCHPDGDRIELTEQQKTIVDDIVEFDEIKTYHGSTVALSCRVKSGRKINIKLYRYNEEGQVWTDLKFDWK